MLCGHSLHSEVLQLFLTATRFAPNWLHQFQTTSQQSDKKSRPYIKQLSVAKQQSAALHGTNKKEQRAAGGEICKIN